MKKCLAVAILASVAATKVSAVGTASREHLNALMEENGRLKALNERLRTQVLKKVGGSAELLHKIAQTSSNSFLESGASPKADSSSKKKDSKPCLKVDDAPGVEGAMNNFCLAPEVCKERLQTCKRGCVNKCWADKYAKNGAPPGEGDIDAARMQIINTRVKQMLKQVNIDTDCRPCSSSVQDSVVVSLPKAASANRLPVQRLPPPPKGGDAEGVAKLSLLEVAKTS